MSVCTVAVLVALTSSAGGTAPSARALADRPTRVSLVGELRQQSSHFRFKENRDDRMHPAVVAGLASAGLIGAGAVSWLGARWMNDQLRAGDTTVRTRTELTYKLVTVRVLEVTGWTLAGAGVAGLGYTTWLALQPRADREVSLLAAPVNGGAIVTMQGVLP